MVQTARLTKGYLARLQTRNSTVNEHVRDTESSGLLATRFAKSGQISFVYIGRIKGSVKREITIGRYPDTNIEEARIRASELRKLYRQGIDPKQLEADQQAAQEQKKALAHQTRWICRHHRQITLCRSRRRILFLRFVLRLLRISLRFDLGPFFGLRLGLGFRFL